MPAAWCRRRVSNGGLYPANDETFSVPVLHVLTDGIQLKKLRQQSQRHEPMIWSWNEKLSYCTCFLLKHISLTKSAKRWREIYKFEVLTTTQSRSSKSSIVCFYVKTISANQVHFMQRRRTKWPKCQDARFSRFLTNDKDLFSGNRFVTAALSTS